MSKAHRGRNLIEEFAKKGRGTCPVCKRSGIKLLYEQEAGEKKIKICKQCRSAIAKGKKQEELAAV